MGQLPDLGTPVPVHWDEDLLGCGEQQRAVERNWHSLRHWSHRLKMTLDWCKQLA